MWWDMVEDLLDRNGRNASWLSKTSGIRLSTITSWKHRHADTATIKYIVMVADAFCISPLVLCAEMICKERSK